MQRVITSDGVEIAVHDFGGQGPPLLLAHATGFHGLVWRPVAERLGGSFRCVSFDMRGHGDSGRPPDGDFAWEGFARDALAVIEGLGLRRPFAVGHSCGGATLLLAEEGSPGTFRALYCYEPVVTPSDGPAGLHRANPLSAGARRRRAAFPSRDAAYNHYASKPPLEVLDPAALRAYVDYGFADAPGDGVRLKCRPDDEAAIFARASAHGAFRQLREVHCPVTLAWGVDDEPLGRGLAEQMAARLAAPVLAPLPGLGHFGPMEDPGRVAAAVVTAFTSEATPR